MAGIITTFIPKNDETALNTFENILNDSEFENQNNLMILNLNGQKTIPQIIQIIDQIRVNYRDETILIPWDHTIADDENHIKAANLSLNHWGFNIQILKTISTNKEKYVHIIGEIK